MWLADLNGERVIIYRVPTPEGYRDVREARGLDVQAPLAFPALTLTADQVLGG